MKRAIIIGSGFAGSVSARILAENNFEVQLYEKRDHIGGNCYDEVDKNGILIHTYGPHLFHTSNKKVWDFLSRFTSWQAYEHKVRSHIKGKNVILPFNFNTIEQLFDKNEAEEYINLLKKNYKRNSKVPILKLKKNKILKKLSDFIYEYLFKNYTLKQWGIKPEELDESVSARVPIFIGRDNRYFNDTYQALPKAGYTKLFENLINHKNITLHLSKDTIKYISFKKDKISFNKEIPDILIFTGALDELFDYKFGELKYRSIDMQFESIEKEWFQENTTINYPNDFKFTRITEFKYLYPYKSHKTTILKEYPIAHIRDKNIRYYPFLTDDTQNKYMKYEKESQVYKNLLLLGRLAEYKYYDMDDVVLKAIEILGRKQIQSLL